MRHTVTVVFRYRNGNNWTTINASRSATGYGEATLEWSWNQWTGSVQSISVTGGGATVEQTGNTRYLLTIPDSNTNVTVTVSVENSNYDPWTNYSGNPYGNTIGNVVIRNTPSAQEGEFTSGGTKRVRLGDNGVWTQTFTVAGDGLLSDSSSSLPATYTENGIARPCYYTITENQIPSGFELVQISTDKVQYGILTAYNKKTERGSLAIKKLLSVSADPPTNGNTSLANGRYNFTISRPAPTQENPDATEIIKYVQIRIKDGRTAYKVSDTAISFDDTEDFEHVYFEGAIVDDLIPGTYFVTETTHQLDNSPAYNMELVDIDADGNEENEASLADKTTKVIVTADDLPKVFSSFTNMLIPEVDVPVVKTWVWSGEDNGEVSSWSATFNLEYREVLVSGEADSDAATRWTPVYEDDTGSGEPEQRSVTITSSSAEGTGYFTDLPIYKIHDNGSVYRLIYAVDEVSYTVSFSGGRPDKTWNKNASGHLDQHYSPTYEQDAGEDEEPEDLVSWYTIKLTNGESTKETINEIDLSIRKTWENDNDNVISGDAGSYAKFRLMRTYHEESLDLSRKGLANNDPVTVKLMSGSETISNLVVPGGAPVYVVGLVEPGETVDLAFSDGSNMVNLTGGSDSSAGQQFVVSSSCFTAAENLVVQLGAGNTEVLVGGMSGLRLASFDTAENGGYDISVEYPNDAFNNQPAGQEFTLSNADEWQKNWVKLPQVVEERTISGDHVVLKTIVYSYYLVETECNPVNFDAVFTDEEGNPIGDVRNPVSSDTKIVAENREITEATVRKIWDDDDDERELRPSTLTVELYANGEDTGRHVTLTSENWTTGKTISNLPKYHNGAAIDYYWIEGSLPSGYFMKSIAKRGTVTTLTNSYSEYDLKTSYSGTKTWADSDNLYNLRPEELPVKLQRKVGDGEWEDYRDDPSWEKTGSSWTYIFDELPVFDESGNVYLYQAVESEPTGYDGSTSYTATEYHFGEITYLSHAESKQRITEDNKLVWNLESLIDLAFAAVKTTRNDSTTVWTSRTPTPQEREAIENYLNNSQSDPLPGHNHRLVWVHGSEVVDASHGVIGFEMNGLTVTISFSGPSVWSQFVYGQFNNEGGQDSTYNIGRTDFTNTLETASLSGTKTWYVEGEDIPADPTLELTRTYQIVTIVDETMTVTESEPEVVTIMSGGETVPLQPTWEGEGITRTFTYSNLPKYDLHGRQYIYRVRETRFVIGEGDDAITYTVQKNLDGTFTAVADKPEADSFTVTQDAHNNIVNSSLIANLEIIKVEKGYWDNSHTIDGAVFKLTLVDENNHDIVGGGVYTSGNVTVENGKLIFENLRPGRYKLEEITPPTGYVLVESPWYFEIDNTSKASLDETYIMASVNSSADNSFYIQNERGAELPSTGGPGTRLFTILGLILIAGAGLLLLRRRRTI